MQAAVRLLIVDDHALVSDGISALLRDEAGVDVVGVATNGRDALEKAEQLRPDVVLMDINMPVMDGLQAARNLRETMPEVRVLVLTMHDEDEYVSRVMRAGAAGYVRKDISAENLLRAIVSVHAGLDIFPKCTVESPNPPENILTPCQTKVLILLVKGTLEKRRVDHTSIAAELGVSRRTVENHVRDIYIKLGERTPLALVQYAETHGLI